MNIARWSDVDLSTMINDITGGKGVILKSSSTTFPTGNGANVGVIAALVSIALVFSLAASIFWLRNRKVQAAKKSIIRTQIKQ